MVSDAAILLRKLLSTNDFSSDLVLSLLTVQHGTFIGVQQAEGWIT